MEDEIRGAPQIEAKQESADRKEKAANDGWMVIFTGLLALVTTALAIYTARLFGATQRMVVGAEETARRQLRAYVGLVDISITGIDLGTDGLHFPGGMTLRFKNNGQTPAYDYVNRMVVRSGDYPPKRLFEVNKIISAGKLVLQPGEEALKQFKVHEIAPQDRHEFVEGIAAIWIF